MSHVLIETSVVWSIKTRCGEKARTNVREKRLNKVKRKAVNEMEERRNDRRNILFRGSGHRSTRSIACGCIVMVWLRKLLGYRFLMFLSWMDSFIISIVSYRKSPTAKAIIINSIPRMRALGS